MEILDHNGFPILLADVPNSGGVVTRKTGTEGGNPQHDSQSGKFAPGSQQGDPVQGVPANTDVNAYYRQLDAVRDLAREMDDIESGDIQDLLAGRLTRPLEPEELEAFVQQVRAHRLNDLVDILDYQFRNLIDTIKRGRRKVRVAAPKGWIRKTFNRLSDDEILSVINRLEARGHKREDLQRSVLGRIRKQERADQLGARLAEIPENYQELELAFDNIDDIDFEDDALNELSSHNFSQMLEVMAKKAEQPINVVVNVDAKSGNKVIKRDSNGLVIGLEDEK